MRRKIALFLTAAITLLFAGLRVVPEIYPNVPILSSTLPDVLIVLTVLTLIAIVALSYSKKHEVISLDRTPPSFFGFFATLAGAMITMSSVLDAFNRFFANSRYDFVNKIDWYITLGMVLSGIVSGLFLIMHGFCRMSQLKLSPAISSWMSLFPIIWMWLRLAHFEIGNASTINISKSFFDLAVLIASSLFFLQVAHVITNVGAQPKNSLFIFSLFTTVCTVSSLPLTVYRLANNASINDMMIYIVDVCIGIFAFLVALFQIFPCKITVVSEDEDIQTEAASDESSDNDLAWNTPQKERKPLDPPFSLEEKLPTFDDEPKETTHLTATQTQDDLTELLQPAKSDVPSADITVDDILAELDKTV